MVGSMRKKQGVLSRFVAFKSKNLTDGGGGKGNGQKDSNSSGETGSRDGGRDVRSGAHKGKNNRKIILGDWGGGDGSSGPVGGGRVNCVGLRLRGAGGSCGRKLMRENCILCGDLCRHIKG